MGRLTEYKYLIEAKELPSETECLCLCPSLSVRDRNIVKKIRKQQRILDRESKKN